MSIQNGRDYLLVVWKDIVSRSRFEIGRLSKNGKFEFEYIIDNVTKAKKKNFELLTAFPVIEKKYINESLFPAFSSRLPDKRRKDIDKILNKYNLSTYDEFELLRHSGGKLPIDTLEFVDPINLEESHIERNFYVAGVRHHELCKKPDMKNCDNKLDINIGDELKLICEENNKYDKFAIELRNASCKKLGYIPTYFSEQVYTAKKDNRPVKCIVKDIRQENCQECVEVTLIILN